MTLKPALTAHELDALLAKPIHSEISPDKYFPIRLFIILVLSVVWFIRMTVFTHDMAAELFADPVLRNFITPALYFRAWVLFAFVSVGAWCYHNTKYPALAFGMLLVGSLFNMMFDITIFYSERIAQQDPLTTLFFLGRLSLVYILYISMRNAHRIPKGRDKWNLMLPFKAVQSPSISQ